MLAPPFVITEPELDDLVKRFSAAWTKTHDRISAKGGSS
jgi:hypothetical protein